ncbi:MAG: hypothetical protein IKU37_07360 [Candidatus Gastranaerophilales bacterium]|nr:hypothetical protein [Candidatus Gastranaerophilales bacterium]
MEHGKMVFDEAKLASMLRQEILNNSQSIVEASPKQKDLSGFEYISTQKQPYISPIMTMNEDEILAFVEEFDVNELATLSVAELNRIGEVLGVEPNILLGMKD